MRIAVLSFTGRGAGVNKRLCEELAKPGRGSGVRRNRKNKPEEPDRKWNTGARYTDLKNGKTGDSETL